MSLGPALAVRAPTPRLAALPPVTVLDAAVLATLAYHDFLDLPLTAVEVWRYLLAPKEHRTLFAENHPPALHDVEASLRALVANGVLHAEHGFFVLAGRRALIAGWPEKHARSQQKWRRLRRIVFWLQVTPFLRGVAGTGSLAFDNAKPTSDLDVFIIAAPNRVWTVRFFLTVLLDAFRLRRRPQGVTRDRVCLNHYLAADALSFPYRSLYTALEYARMVPLLGEEACWAFRAANRPWMQDFLLHVFPDAVRHRKAVRTSPLLQILPGIAEWLLAGRIGDVLERQLARLQRSRIERSETTKEPRGRVVATDTRAEFHPQSREAPILAAFNARMEALGLGALFGDQADSGLTL
ncbi:MAG: hypothetical protein G01um101438_316 [Parcubacteria group bacterium Gr01-1014_38]|nr:MAG: hypothetical protein G01um101438_316 [Parcubacteria group bacterium Gr01-1014_38]